MYMRVVKAFNMENDERERFKVVAHDVYKKSLWISFYGALSRVNNEMLGVSMVSLSVLGGGYLVLNQSEHLFGIRMCDAPMSVATIFTFYAFLIGIADPLRKMADVYNQVQGGVVAADRVFPLADKVPAIQESSANNGRSIVEYTWHEKQVSCFLPDPTRKGQMIRCQLAELTKVDGTWLLAIHYQTKGVAKSIRVTPQMMAAQCIDQLGRFAIAECCDDPELSRTKSEIDTIQSWRLARFLNQENTKSVQEPYY